MREMQILTTERKKKLLGWTCSERLTVYLNAKMRKPFRAGDKMSHFRQWSFFSVRRSFKVKRHLSPDLEDRSYLDTWLTKTEPHKKHL